MNEELERTEIELSLEDLQEIRSRLVSFNYTLITQRFPEGMSMNLRQDVSNFLVIKSKQTDALVAKLYDIIKQKEKVAPTT